MLKNEHAKQNGQVCFKSFERLSHLPIFQRKEEFIKSYCNFNKRGLFSCHAHKIRFIEQNIIRREIERTGKSFKQKQKVYILGRNR